MSLVECYFAGVFDMNITQNIKESGNLMDIQLQVHLIVVPEEKYHDMADDGQIKIRQLGKNMIH